MLYFISGGVRSGKSTFALNLALSFAHPANTIYYVATSIPYDAEMNERIKRHQKERRRLKNRIVTIEQPKHIEVLSEKFSSRDVVLIDCLTTLVSNELFHGWEKKENHWQKERYRKDVFTRLIATITNLKKKEITVIIVSNELANGMMPQDEGTFYYLEMLGKLHTELVSLADYAILVENGIPIYKKGREMRLKELCFKEPLPM